jgi:hypothetical protein
MRITASVGFDGSDTGTKFWPPSLVRLDAESRIAMGIPLRSASLTQRRKTLALSPRAKAIAAMDTPGCWHSPTASALKSGLWLRRRRRPIPTACSVVRTCTPIALNKRASLHHYRRAKRCLSRTLTLLLLINRPTRIHLSRREICPNKRSHPFRAACSPGTSQGRMLQRPRPAYVVDTATNRDAPTDDINRR